MSVNEKQVLDVLRTVMDPDLNQDLVSLGFVKNLKIEGGKVSFTIELTTPACPVRERFKRECDTKLRALDGVTEVEIYMTSRVSGRADFERAEALAGVRNSIAVASGKGGVGKSTVAANLALALSKTGARVGLLDCDIYGPSIPLMFGLKGRMPEVSEDQKILPLEAHGISIMSIGLLTTEDTPVIWRGPMVHNMIQQFLTQIKWSSLDYLILDLPPGTGDVQLTLTQSALLSGAVIVTTPQQVSLIDAEKGLKMFEKVNVPVLGLIENMSYFACPDCGKVAEIFKRGGGKELAHELEVPFLGELPIDPDVVRSGDEGAPIIVRNPVSPSAKAYEEIAARMAAQLSIANLKAGSGCETGNFKWKKND